MSKRSERNERNELRVPFRFVEPIHQALVGAVPLVATLGDRLEVRKVLREFEAGPFADLEAERQRIINEYAVRNDADRPVVRDDGTVDFGEHEDAAMAEWRRLLDAEVVVPRRLSVAAVASLPNEDRFEVLELLVA